MGKDKLGFVFRGLTRGHQSRNQRARAPRRPVERGAPINELTLNIAGSWVGSGPCDVA